MGKGFAVKSLAKPGSAARTSTWTATVRPSTPHGARATLPVLAAEGGVKLHRIGSEPTRSDGASIPRDMPGAAGSLRAEVQLMGAWGSKAFENDGACDFLDDLAGGGADALASLLTGIAAMDRGEYLDVDDATAGVAAAELVAAAHGAGDDRLSPAATRWIVAFRDEAKGIGASVALRAVERIYAASELHDLWSEGSDTSEWHDHMRELSRRLEALE